MAVLFVYWYSDSREHRDYERYEVYFEGSVSGLQRGASVRYLGVEVGQLAIVSAFLPVAYWLRASWFYRRLVFIGGSLAITAVAGIWLIERAFNLKIISA